MNRKTRITSALAAERLLDALRAPGAAPPKAWCAAICAAIRSWNRWTCFYPKIAALYGDAAALEFLRETVRGRSQPDRPGPVDQAQPPGLEPEQRVDADVARTRCKATASG